MTENGDAIHLLMSSNSVRNTAFSCDSLGIQYEVSHSDGIVKVERWNSFSDQNDFVAEFKLPVLKDDVIRFRPDYSWTLLKEFLVKDGGPWYSQ